jgi:catechol 2,3-dioxygenase-like lactoylglutathione lyase family enzyme
MDFPIIDHIVISTTNFKRSIRFYSVFLGKPKTSKFDACWELGDTKLFLTFPYKKSAKAFDKHNIGLNHLAFRVKTNLQKQKSNIAVFKSINTVTKSSFGLMIRME